MPKNTVRSAGFCLVSLAMLCATGAAGQEAFQFSMPSKSDPHTAEYLAREMAPLDKLTPVTKEMLRNPPVGRLDQLAPDPERLGL